MRILQTLSEERVSFLIPPGLAYPLFYVFLPDYLASRGAQTGQSGAYYTWRNYMISSVVSIFGPVAAGLMCNVPWLGRKYTMVIGALVTMAFFFAYTAVRTPAQNLGFTCAISFCINVYYGCRKWLQAAGMVLETLTTICSICVHSRGMEYLISSLVPYFNHTIGLTIGPSCHRKRNCGCLQPNHGFDLLLCRRLWKHSDFGAHLCLCCSLHPHGKTFGSISVLRTSD